MTTTGPVRTFGLEEEYLVVSTADGSLGNAEVLLGEPGDITDAAEAEFKTEQIETATAPTADLTALHENVRSMRQALFAAGEPHGLAIAALGTAPQAVRPTLSDDDRYRAMSRQYGAIARDQLTCGCHVHVSVADDHEGVAVIDRLRVWLHVLRALTANSPFWQSDDTGYASYRSVVWGQWPSAGPPEIFGDAATYTRTVATLTSTGLLLDEKMTYFDARLSPNYPTVEIRVGDVCDFAEDATLLAALCRALVDAMADDWRRGEPAPPVRTEILRAAAWGAARYGMSAELIDPVAGQSLAAAALVRRLVDRVGPYLTASDATWVSAAVADVIRRGTGADRQRESWRSSRSVPTVIGDAVRRTRGDVS